MISYFKLGSIELKTATSLYRTLAALTSQVWGLFHEIGTIVVLLRCVPMVVEIFISVINTAYLQMGLAFIKEIIFNEVVHKVPGCIRLRCLC